MNRLRYMDEAVSQIKDCVVREIAIHDRGGGSSIVNGIEIRTKDNITHSIYHDRSCCEFVKVELPENIANIHNKRIGFVFVNTVDGEHERFDYSKLAEIRIVDSLGEEYIIEFTAKSCGCVYVPHIRAQKEWTVCVFD